MFHKPFAAATARAVNAVLSRVLAVDLWHKKIELHVFGVLAAHELHAAITTAFEKRTFRCSQQVEGPIQPHIQDWTSQMVPQPCLRPGALYRNLPTSSCLTQYYGSKLEACYHSSQTA
jgi:hypothetical protein